jgi:hypothetical protein
VPRRRSGRFVLEALFLAGVAAAVTVAQLRPAGVIVLMALAWVIVALLEWTAWLDEPHYGRGLPPRFYVPQVALPPPRAVEQLGRYPVILEPDDDTTFETAVTEWAAGLDEWPVLDLSPADEETQIAIPDEGFDERIEFDRVLDPGPGLEPEWEPPVEDAAAGEPAAAEPALIDEVLAFAEPEPLADRPERDREPEPARQRLAPVERVAATAVHHIDPLTPSVRRRLFRRALDAAVVEVPDGPPPDRRLPGRAAATTRTSQS